VPLFTQVEGLRAPSVATAILALGFLMLAAYWTGYFGELLKLPGITHYIVAELAVGPRALGYIKRQTADDLWFLNKLTLAFIVVSELRLSRVRKNSKACCSS
jgi:Kef-type K+ transport system membrane component KefB